MDGFWCVELAEGHHIAVVALLRKARRGATRAFEIRDANGIPVGVTYCPELAAELGCLSVQRERQQAAEVID